MKWGTVSLVSGAMLCLAAALGFAYDDPVPYCCGPGYHGCGPVYGSECFESPGYCRNDDDQQLYPFDGFQNVDYFVGRCREGTGGTCNPEGKGTTCDTNYFQKSATEPCGTRVCEQRVIAYSCLPYGQCKEQ